MTKVPKVISAYMSSIGKKGGKASGDSQYKKKGKEWYSMLGKRSAEAKKRCKEAELKLSTAKHIDNATG